MRHGPILLNDLVDQGRLSPEEAERFFQRALSLGQQLLEDSFTGRETSMPSPRKSSRAGNRIRNRGSRTGTPQNTGGASGPGEGAANTTRVSGLGELPPKEMIGQTVDRIEFIAKQYGISRRAAELLAKKEDEVQDLLVKNLRNAGRFVVRVTREVLYSDGTTDIQVDTRRNESR